MGAFDLFEKNLNLQTEMDRFMFGSDVEAPKGRDVIYRRIRLDSNNNPIKCVCVSNITDEADKDTYCPFCLGSKYYWDEEFVKAYWHRPGADDNLVFYFNHDVAPSGLDELITVKFDDDGNTITPIERVSIYNILPVDLLREDYGELAYYRVLAAPMNRRYMGPQ